MPVKSASPREDGTRAGLTALALLSAPRNYLILRSLAEGPKRQVELRRKAGFPAQTTLRGHLKALEEAGAVTKSMRDPFPAVLEYELDESGRDLLPVCDALTHWLQSAPEDLFELGSEASKVAIKALVDSWSSTILHCLAEEPRSLTELDDMIPTHNYPSIERRLAAMRLAGQLEASNGRGKSTPYSVTEWMRRAVGPLIASASWEERHRSGAAKIVPLDVEAAFLLTAPLLEPPADARGTCAMRVELATRGKDRAAGVALEIADGAVKPCAPPIPDDCESWASGTPMAWFGAVIDGDASEIEVQGNDRVPRILLEGLHQALFPV
ncbi:MAG TPA: helix-turn-helix domain-containing protein [Solirubrobacterales bacterium]|nr:helix-turn-helix domain-containing protein [Solirubrobacterales bacterium]